MERRAFLRTLGGLFVAAAAPTKTYAFFGDILRPRPNLLYGTPIIAGIEYEQVTINEVWTRRGPNWVYHMMVRDIEWVRQHYPEPPFVRLHGS